jgi:hypothetical protein
MSLEFYPVKTGTDPFAAPPYFIEFRKRSDGTTTWQLFRRQFIFPKEQFEAMSKAGDCIQPEGHPWNLGEGEVDSPTIVSMHTRKFLEHIVDALNEKDAKAALIKQPKS